MANGLPLKKRPIEWNSITFLLTFPQWEGNDTLERLLQKLINFWKLKKKEVKEAIICIEDHGKVMKMIKIIVKKVIKAIVMMRVRIRMNKMVKVIVKVIVVMVVVMVMGNG